MAKQVVKIAKIGKNAEIATDPNDFIFHSDYNTFKIIATGIYSPTISASSTETKTIAHNLSYIPLVHAFAKAEGIAYVILPNEGLYNPIGLESTTITFNYIQADVSNIILNITNNTGSNLVVNIKYYIFEVPL